MWLDRFSGNSPNTGSQSPSQNRSFSPAPRRPGYLAPGATLRPGFSPRSSSLQLGLKSNASTTSISSARPQNGSTLKQQITPPPDLTNPLELLADIVGRPLLKEALEDEDIEDADILSKPSELIEEVEFNGLGLYGFVSTGVADGGETINDSDIFSQAVEECEYVYSITMKWIGS